MAGGRVGNSTRQSAGLRTLLAFFLASPLTLLFSAGRSPSFAAPAPPSSSTSAPSPAPPSPSSWCARRFVNPLLQLVGADRDVESGNIDLDVAVDAAIRTVRRGLGDKVTFHAIVATLPDPIDSAMTYGFDTTLQALRRGVEQRLGEVADAATTDADAAAYNRDRQWLPWDDSEGLPSKRSDAEECRRSTPGILLFRRPKEVLALLLVGETPTTGVHVRTLVAALQVAQLFGPADGQRKGPPETTIVGPTYSGTAESMQIALAQWIRTRDSGVGTVRIVSGSATGGGLHDTLAADRAPLNATRGCPDAGSGTGALPAGLCGSGNWNGDTTVTFEATSTPESSAECAYLRFLTETLGVTHRDGGTLPNVALLHESGTAFGAQGTQGTLQCGLAPEVDVSFPVHIAALRDAYEDLDRKSVQQNPTISRPTALDVSLREKQPLDIEAAPSPKTTYARDIALTNILSQTSREGVRHVAIEATDIADAIFLARKIRDVAPDVRLAFFEQDALLMHPAFRRDLLGSIVVSPYPFLGTDDFAVGAEAHSHEAFESSPVLGTFNAVLAARNAAPAALREYFRDKRTGLPLVWITTIARTNVVPLALQTPMNCDGTLYGADGGTKAPGCDNDSGKAWGNSRPQPELSVDPDVSPPRLWHLVYALLALGCLLDSAAQARTRRTLSKKEADETRPSDTRPLDQAVGRTKWMLYAVVRTFLFAFALLYMDLVYLSALCTYHDRPLLGFKPARFSIFEVLLLALVWAPTVFAVVGTLFALFRFLKYRDKNTGLRPAVDRLLSQLPPEAVRSRRRWRLVAFDRPTFLGQTANTSIAQIQLIAATASSLSAWFVLALARETLSGLRWNDHVATSAPWLLLVACIDAWVLGRIACLAEARVLSASPIDGRTRRSLRFVAVVAPATAKWLGIALTVEALLRFDLSDFSAWATGGHALAISAPILLVLIEATSQNLCARGPLRAPRLVFCFLLTLYAALGFAVTSDALLGVPWNDGEPSAPRTLYVLRTLPLLDGVSIATPALLIVACVYVWSVGRMARLREAHALSRMAPNGSMNALVSTPIRYILYPSDKRSDTPPDGQKGFTEDCGFTAVERDSLNAIWRPGTGRHYVVALVVMAFIPVVVFLLKPLSTLEDAFGTLLCDTGIALAFLLISSTLIQLLQYWLAIQALLQRVMEHRLGRSFCHVNPLVRESIDAQVSRSSFDMLRIVGCAQQLAELVCAAPKHRLTPSSAEREELGTQDVAIRKLRAATLSAAAEFNHEDASRLEAELASQVIESARQIMDILQSAWQGQRGKEPRVEAETGEKTTAKTGEPHDEPVDALTPVAHRFEADELRWLRLAQAFVATVVALLLNRHVRQFRYFLYTLTASASLLLLTFSSYTFEPFRLLLTCMWLIMGTVVVSGLYVFLEFDRNPVLSRIAGTTPNRVTFDWAFSLRVFSWVFIPLLGVAAAQYPDLGNVLYRLLEPFTRSLK